MPSTNNTGKLASIYNIHRWSRIYAGFSFKDCDFCYSRILETGTISDL